jgi:hypothetical protein
VMKERTLCQTGRLADVVHRARRVALRASSGFFSLKKKGDLVGWVRAGSGNAGVRSGKSQRLAVVTARGDPLHLWSRALESVKKTCRRAG